MNARLGCGETTVLCTANARGLIDALTSSSENLIGAKSMSLTGLVEFFYLHEGSSSVDDSFG